MRVGPHFHQTAAEAAGVHPEGPFKIKDPSAPAVETLQGARASWTATLKAHTGTLCWERFRRSEKGYSRGRIADRVKD